ncbi:2-oxoglutaramate amidase [Streptomyces sp. RB5]|uniref:2-oxoglutaramate amidase n=1 Tax=Streptomyces smaragdinus TaxID=2585196 RepID=A0A7K0CGZ8_9ACTN|nr:carbon-nitrogen family hydrolase [Streptomyces smaragdinus]MQY12755.1 2-oxoglutaramate amidase [Streptomyces smaragdinus]
MRVSLLQMAVNTAESPESRREAAGSLVRDQNGADLVVLPELWPVGAFAFESFEAEAEPLDGPTGQAMSAAARDAGVWLHGGSIVERTAKGDLCNTSLLFAPDGELAAVYRKIHRFGFDRGEATLMVAGEEIVTAPAAGTVLGLATCYDLRFPEVFRRLLDAGAETIVLPAGWPAARGGHWRTLAIARAIENQAYVLACGTAGTHAGVEQNGRSLIVAPDGEVLAEAGPGQEVLTAELDLKRVAAYREKFPVHKDRRLF